MEGILKKRRGDDRRSSFFKLNSYKKVLNQKRWFVLKDSYLAYMKQDKHDQVSDVMLMDR